MPTHNDFTCQVHRASRRKYQAFCRTDAFKEYGKRVSDDGKTVTCWIAAKAGEYFQVYWWYGLRSRGKNNTGVDYSAQFFRDGEAVFHIIFPKECSTSLMGFCDGWKDEYASTRRRRDQLWAFQFRSFECTGGEGADNVPHDIGKLQLIIRKLRGNGNYGPLEEITQPDSDEHYREAQEGWREGGSHNEFEDWKNPQPRHTHYAEMVKADGTTWNRRCVTRLSSLPTDTAADDDDILVKFVFFFTTLEQILTVTVPPPPPPPMPQLSQDDESSTTELRRYSLKRSSSPHPETRPTKRTLTEEENRRLAEIQAGERVFAAERRAILAAAGVQVKEEMDDLYQAVEYAVVQIGDKEIIVLD